MDARAAYELVLQLRPSPQIRSDAEAGVLRSEVGERQAREEAATHAAAERQAELKEISESRNRIPTATAALNLGHAVKDTDPTVAALYYERALELSSDRDGRLAAAAALAGALRRSGEIGRAIAVLEDAVHEEPDPRRNRACHTSLVAALRDSDRLTVAKRRADELIEALPDDRFALNAVAAVYADLGRKTNDAALLRRSAEYFIKAANSQPMGRDPVKRVREVIAALEELGAKRDDPAIIRDARLLERRLEGIRRLR